MKIPLDKNKKNKVVQSEITWPEDRSSQGSPGGFPVYCMQYVLGPQGGLPLRRQTPFPRWPDPLACWEWVAVTKLKFKENHIFQYLRGW
jgi:hypothetical protein